MLTLDFTNALHSFGSPTNLSGRYSLKPPDGKQSVIFQGKVKKEFKIFLFRDRADEIFILLGILF